MVWIMLAAGIAVIVLVVVTVERRNRRTFNNDSAYRPEDRPLPEDHPSQGSGGSTIPPY